MALSLDDLVTPLTEDGVLETWLTELETLGVPARSWRKAGVYRTILRVVAKGYAGYTQVQVAFIRSGFIDLAEGGWLTLLARYVYGVEREPASFASEKLRLVNGGGGVYTRNPGEVRILNRFTRKAYVNTEAFTLNGGETKEVAFGAVEAGSASSCGVDEITEFETILIGVTATNPRAFVGVDEQTDLSLRDTCKAKLATLGGKGPRGAYDYAIQVAKLLDGTPANVNRWEVFRDPLTGTITIYLASPTGVPGVSDITAVQDSIEAVARPDTVTATAVAASALAINRSITVWARRTVGLTSGAVQAAVSAALAKMISTYPIGGIAKPPSSQGYLFASFIEGTAVASHPAVYACDVAGGDYAINVGQVASLTVAISVRFET